VYRTGQRFGVGHLTAVLRGEADERVRALRHDQLSTYGVGADLDKQQWRGVFRQLVAIGLLTPDDEGYGTLRLTAASRAVLRGEQAVHLRRQADRGERRARRQQAHGVRSRGRLDIATHAAPMWDALRGLRARLAKEQGVPAYVIFHDATLLAMLRERPQTLGALGAISGVGERKLERYGEAFLDAVNARAA
jgi:ATP-dependent DNA helicase RecQ